MLSLLRHDQGIGPGIGHGSAIGIGLAAQLLEQPAELAVQRQVGGHLARVPGVERLGDPVHHVRREGEGLGHLAHGRSGAVGDDVADHGRVIDAIAAVEVLDDLLAAVDVEVDVDVGQGARLVDEALEQELVLDGVDLGDAQAVGHDRVAGTPPPLADDPVPPRELHEVPHDQEELGQVRAVDDGQLVGQLLEGLLGNRADTACVSRRGQAGTGTRTASPRRGR